jgi:hypothetical protein
MSSEKYQVSIIDARLGFNALGNHPIIMMV